MTAYTVTNYDSNYVDASLLAKKIDYDADYQDVVLSSPLVIYGPPRRKYDMRGFDSVGDTKVYWSSYNEPITAPATTNPTLVGSLVFPHILGDYMST